ncbi:putative glycoside hydrolase family 3 protein [Phaeoacremonium minimum UCRPA7]|uniref:xylan 1,4-beta-xylosidase n=1 Tax=Phaeoacremonium minimum (strain UCR-PA7) TaxID=1286976 RepID=R8BCX4_PHAM7|nr:putative glycoside hydrolase family 3 protein [Phaeoacremonium minimum UCRPA7]EON97153.1 putative glycoside hydrolase family 3 protein [Phaeoacremonium minimum UCRPA7]
MMWCISIWLAVCLLSRASLGDYKPRTTISPVRVEKANSIETTIVEKDQFIDALVTNMTVPDLVMQLHLMFAGDIVGMDGDNTLYEAWGEDKVLTSHMGVAYASGLSKNSSWSAPDAVVPVMKHFAAHGAPQSGRNAAPFMGHGNRQILQDLLTPFKAAVQLGGVRGVMMAYNELDDIPASVQPMLYDALEEWGYDGFIMADDTADSPADAIKQWFNAGGMLQFYDYPLEVFLNSTIDLVSNGSVELTTLQSHVKKMLGVKWDLGLFQDPYIHESVDPKEIAEGHNDLTLEAAQKSIVLLENKNSTLPLQPSEQNISRVALIGPFTDTLNYGDYSGSWGQYPADAAKTLRQGLFGYTKNTDVEVVSSWGANTWEYNSQYVIPSYLLSTPNGTIGGLEATYFANPNFTLPIVQVVETPALDWGMYPPPGLPSNNFSAIWEGQLESPVDTKIDVDGWIGLAVSPNTTAKLFIDDELIVAHGFPDSGTVLGNIMQYSYIKANSTLAPAGSMPFTFTKGAKYKIRIEYQAFTLYKRIENVVALNSQLILFWNLVSRQGDAVAQAVRIANSSDVIVLAVGAAWNSDAESGDRATLGLPPSQDILAQEIYKLGKPVVLVLQGGRPFGIDYYNQSAAALSAFFPGQSGGQAIADVLFGKVNPGGRMPVTIPRHVGQIPVYYNYKSFAHKKDYLDTDSSPAYWFGWGLSYTTFDVSGFSATISGRVQSDFTSGDIITFAANVKNNGTIDGSYVAQVYLLGRVSSIVQPVKQLVAFQRVYVDAGKEAKVLMELDVDRYLTILNRKNEWELEKGTYTFALLTHGGDTADTSMNIPLRCV